MEDGHGEMGREAHGKKKEEGCQAGFYIHERNVTSKGKTSIVTHLLVGLSKGEKSYQKGEPGEGRQWGNGTRPTLQMGKINLTTMEPGALNRVRPSTREGGSKRRRKRTDEKRKKSKGAVSSLDRIHKARRKFHDIQRSPGDGRRSKWKRSETGYRGKKKRGLRKAQRKTKERKAERTWTKLPWIKLRGGPAVRGQQPL